MLKCFIYCLFCIGSFLFGNDQNHDMAVAYNEHSLPSRITISTFGHITYIYNDNNELTKVQRFDSDDNLMYEHEYVENGELLIGNLGKLEYKSSPNELTISSDFGCQKYRFDDRGNTIYRELNGKEDFYEYDEKDQMLIGKPGCFFCYDNNYDNNVEIINRTDDALVFTYDEEDRLMKTSTHDFETTYEYDKWWKRISKTVVRAGSSQEHESYLYVDDNEIAILDEHGNLKQLRIPGKTFHPSLVRAIAIEIDGKPYAPIHDHACNIVQLIDVATCEVINYDISPFGDNLQELNPITPLVYATQHYDAETDLIQFRYRYYAPSIIQWLTRDPLCCYRNNEITPYLYNFNNPFRYTDPDGRWAIVVPIVWEGGKWLAAAALATWASYKISKSFSKGKWKDMRIAPPYCGKKLGNKGSKKPGKGFEWEGKDEPGGRRGAWCYRKKKQSLHPDLNHPGNVKPHWDYDGPEGKCKLNLDGTWDPKF